MQIGERLEIHVRIGADVIDVQGQGIFGRRSNKYDVPSDKNNRHDK